jgi:hypothetical protein
MILVLTAILIVGFISIAVIGIKEAEVGVRRLEAETSQSHPIDPEESTPMHPSQWSPATSSSDPMEESRFTSTLLSLSRAQIRLMHSSQGPALDESSSLVSVRQPQSKSPAEGL